MRRILNKYSLNLLSLSISECIDLLPSQIPAHEPLIYAPKLRKFVLHPGHLDFSVEFFSSLLSGFPHLTFLDLSDCNFYGNLAYLSNCSNLTTLILYNVPKLQDAIQHICKLSQLRLASFLFMQEALPSLIIISHLCHFYYKKLKKRSVFEKKLSIITVQHMSFRLFLSHEGLCLVLPKQFTFLLVWSHFCSFL